MFAGILAIEGFALGGLFNVLYTNEIVRLSRGDDRRAEMISNLACIISSFACFGLEAVMGVCLGFDEDKEEKEQYRGVFWVLFAVSLLQLGCYIAKGVRAQKTQLDDNKSELH